MAINLTETRHQLLTLPAAWLIAIFVAGWMGKGWIADQLGFVTTAMASEDRKEIEQRIEVVSEIIEEIQVAQNEHIREFKFANAFQLERAYQEDLARHLAENLQTPAWLSDKRKLEGKVRTATEYKSCVLENKPKAICDLLQQQLWQ